MSRIFSYILESKKYTFKIFIMMNMMVYTGELNTEKSVSGVMNSKDQLINKLLGKQ